MSLINEALRRTRDASFQSGEHPSPPGATYRFDDNTESFAFGPRTVIALTALVIALAAAGAIFFTSRVVKTMADVKAAFNSGLQTTQDGTAASTRVASDRRQTQPTPTQSVATPPLQADSKASVNAEPKANEDQLVARVLEKIKAEQPVSPAAPISSEPPKLVLQGITTEGNAREAMINGFTVHEGEEIDGARVTAIESRRVRLQFGAREIVLRMP